MAYGSVRLQRGDDVRLNTAVVASKYPMVMVLVGGCDLAWDVDTLDIAEQLGQRILDGVKAMRDELARRQRESAA